MENKKNNLQPLNFELESNTVWSFPDHGKWATHNSNYRGNWSPYIPRNLILRYSKENDIVLDQFVGGGTTAIEAKLNNRNFIGVDINPVAIVISKKKCEFEWKSKIFIKLIEGDARNLDFIEDNSIDLICTHPPYADIIKYSQNLINDISHLSFKKFLIEIEKVGIECFRVLKKSKYCCILIGDIRKNGMVQPLGFNTMKIFENIGFKIKEIIIKQQFNCQATHYWKNQSIKNNFLLLAHEYLFVFKKL